MKKIKHLVKGLTLCVGVALYGANGADAAQVKNLFTVNVGQLSATQSEDQQVHQALSRILVRVSGYSKVLQRPATQTLFDNAPVLIKRSDNQQIVFDADQVTRLMTNLNLPVANLDRPQVVIWAVNDRGGLVDYANQSSPAVMLVQQMARLRGVPLQVPLLDLDDQLAAPPETIANLELNKIDQASRRYHADAQIVARADTANIGRIRWMFKINGSRYDFVTTGMDDVRKLLNQMFDQLLNPEAVAQASAPEKKVEQPEPTDTGTAPDDESAANDDDGDGVVDAAATSAAVGAAVTAKSGETAKDAAETTDMDVPATTTTADEEPEESTAAPEEESTSVAAEQSESASAESVTSPETTEESVPDEIQKSSAADSVEGDEGATTAEAEAAETPVTQRSTAVEEETSAPQEEASSTTTEPSAESNVENVDDETELKTSSTQTSADFDETTDSAPTDEPAVDDEADNSVDQQQMSTDAVQEDDMVVVPAEAENSAQPQNLQQQSEVEVPTSAPAVPVLPASTDVLEFTDVGSLADYLALMDLVRSLPMVDSVATRSNVGGHVQLEIETKDLPALLNRLQQENQLQETSERRFQWHAEAAKDASDNVSDDDTDVAEPETDDSTSAP